MNANIDEIINAKLCKGYVGEYTCVCVEGQKVEGVGRGLVGRMRGVRLFFHR